MTVLTITKCSKERKKERHIEPIDKENEPRLKYNVLLRLPHPFNTHELSDFLSYVMFDSICFNIRGS